MTTTNFYDVIKNIEIDKYLLPDFQRKFVWTDVDRQKKLVASVLAKMPIGSILLLESNQANEYACKLIGSKNKVNVSSGETVHFLLDGQQRITVLTNVFSDIIHYKTSSVSQLASPSLKKRFFLRIPKWRDMKDNAEKNDIFNLRNCSFPLDTPDSIPEFLSGDIEDMIHVESFLANDNMPFNPQIKLSSRLDDFCVDEKNNGYLIPLYLIVYDKDRRALITRRVSSIIDNYIKPRIMTEILDYYTELDDEKKSEFLSEFFYDVQDFNVDEFNSNLEQKIKQWLADVVDYLKSCLKTMFLTEIKVPSEERNRAIDIYENMNKGGVSLDTFDLIMAKVAIENSMPFLERITRNINSEKEYDFEIINRNIIMNEISQYEISKGSYKKFNASMFANCIDSDEEVEKTYLESFLNILSCYSFNKEYDKDTYDITLIKKNKILSLSASQINQNTEIVCNAIDRALFFFETRCGIKDINDIQYKLMLDIVGIIFTNDNWYSSKKVFDLLEGWYWSSILSGEFNSDQNSRMISNLENIIGTINQEEDLSWLNKMRDSILSLDGYSDLDLLLLKRTNEDRWPKSIIRNTLCQYLLSHSYSDLYKTKIVKYKKDPNEEDKYYEVTLEEYDNISVFGCGRFNLEYHHIVPLGTVANYEESTKSLRKSKDNILNSPLNFVLITDKANKKISKDSPDQYLAKINPVSKNVLKLDSSFSISSNVEDYLKQRYDSLKSDISAHVNELIAGYNQV